MAATKMGQTIAEFSWQNETAKVKEELLNDALADAFDESDVEEDTNNVTNMILVELGVEMDSKMTGLEASSRIHGAEKTSTER